MVRIAAADAVRAQIVDAIDKGAKPLIEPSEFEADREGSPYLAPQVLVGVDHGMAIMTEETFGPAIGIMKVESDEEAVRLMNGSHYGLTASSRACDADA